MSITVTKPIGNLCILYFHLGWQFKLFSSLQSLSNVCQGHCKGLYSRERILEVQGVGIVVNATELHHLLPFVLDLKVLCRFLSDPSSKVQLVDLAGFVPHGRLVVEDQTTPMVRLAWLAAFTNRTRRVAQGMNLVLVDDTVQVAVFPFGKWGRKWRSWHGRRISSSC